MLQGAILVWFILTTLSVLFVIWDSLTNGVTSWVQRIAWILVTLYTGPIGLVLYLLACRRPFPGAHDEYTKAPWKQALNSEMHCLAGDATGILIAAAIVPSLSLANGWDITIEYLTAFATGLFVFQALMMRSMYSGNYVTSVKKTIFAETVSMNMMMAGMIPSMILLEYAWPDSGDPLQASFWFRMGLATIVGGLVAYPINYWLVANHLKHGCMTLPGADQPAHALGHRSHESAGKMTEAKSTDHPMRERMDESMNDMSGMDDGQGMPNGKGMRMRQLPPTRTLAWVAGSFIVLFVAIWLTSLIVPIGF